MVKRKLNVVDVLHIGTGDSGMNKTDSSQINNDLRSKPFRNFKKFSKKFKKLNCSSDILNMELSLSRKSTSDGENSMSQDSSQTVESLKNEIWSTKELEEANSDENVRFLDSSSLQNQNNEDITKVIKCVQDATRSKELLNRDSSLFRTDSNNYLEILNDHSKDKDTPSRRADYVHSLLSGRTSVGETIDLVNRIKTEPKDDSENITDINKFKVKTEPGVEVKEEVIKESEDYNSKFTGDKEEDHDEDDYDSDRQHHEKQDGIEDNNLNQNDHDYNHQNDNKIQHSYSKENIERNPSEEVDNLETLDSKDYFDYVDENSFSETSFSFSNQTEQSSEIDRMISMYRKMYNYRFFNKNKSGDGRLRVVVRCRPSSSLNKVVECDKTCVKLLKPGDVNSVFKSQKPKVFEFNFDYIVQEDETTEQLYKESCVDLVQKVIDGTSVTIFAYGSTGSGKTYTISGNENSTGLIFLSMFDLFSYKEQLIQDNDNNNDSSNNNNNNNNNIEFYLSYFEVYNENIYDLLKENERNLHIQEVENIVFVKGLTKVRISSYEDFKKVFEIGNRNRKVFTTNANRCSSRSHAILQIQTTRNSRLTFIDLAGSERMKITENTGDRLKESSHINQSLLALINCINTLSRNSNYLNQTRTNSFNNCNNNSSNNTGTRISNNSSNNYNNYNINNHYNSNYYNNHYMNQEQGVYYDRVKYRDSKLTHLLKNSLTSNCFILMIAHVNPESRFYQDSYNTIKYALRAKDVEITQVITKEGSGKEMMMNFSNELLTLLKFMKKQMNQQQLKLVREHISQSSLVGQTLLLNLLE